MIKIVFKNKIIKVTGHAGFKEHGKDIVCASVSSIIYTTVNGILNIDQKAILFKDTKEYLQIKIENESRVVKILINNMMNLLEDLELQYPKNIKIEKGE